MKTKKLLGIIIICCFITSFIINPIMVKSQLPVTENKREMRAIVYKCMVPMRDGIRLATDVYLPEDIGENEKLPTILVRTPYNKDGLTSFTLTYLISRYAVVLQDMRGRFASEGIDMLFMNASTDGYDTIHWLAAQDWCNGRIGTFGPSALGITQYFMHLAQPPALKTQVIAIGTPDLYHSALYQGGAFREALVVGWLEGIGSEYWLPTIYQQENFSSFWENVTLTNKYSLVKTPAVHQAGWFDCFLQGTIDGFVGYQYESEPMAQGKSYLVIGPWTHGRNFEEEQGEVTFPANSKDDYTLTLANKFFKYYLKEKAVNFHDDHIFYYCMGPDYEGSAGNFWRTTNDWPIPTNYTAFYLHAGNQLSTEEPAENEGADSYFYDPQHPVPTIGGNNLNIAAGPYDQASLETRGDVITFTSEDLTENVEVTGRIKAYLWVSSNCTDTDFTVKLTDVYPDGRSMLIQDGIIRAKYRNNDSKPELLVPGEIVQVEVDLWSSSYIFNAGHKMRVVISSSNYPRFQANPNNGAAIFTNNETLVANNTIYYDQNHPSHILLPINEADPIPTTAPTTSTHNSTEVIKWVVWTVIGGTIVGVTIFVAIICLIIIRVKRRNR
ncbi:MAG: CocE/NonD family hydrolase [Candidatus Heimdallarchaeota archaeon]|nr:CocE/NonD family hydrolase [Candidatus Heimdallarchaeota archaeon]